MKCSVTLFGLLELIPEQDAQSTEAIPAWRSVSKEK
jgi:hypothetical protein